jgi:hypothetical protein
LFAVDGDSRAQRAFGACEMPVSGRYRSADVWTEWTERLVTVGRSCAAGRNRRADY